MKILYKDCIKYSVFQNPKKNTPKYAWIEGNNRLKYFSRIGQESGNDY